MSPWLGFIVIPLTWCALIMSIWAARRWHLLDLPDGTRKQHQRPVPLVGGIAIFSGVSITLIILSLSQQHLYFLLAGSILITAGVLDDKFNIGVKLRFIAQTTAALVMVLGADIRIESLGNLLGLGVIELGLWSVPFTVFATLGIINAFNMIDGIDGLAGSLSLVALVSMAYLCLQTGVTPPWLLVLTTLAILPYLVFNLELLGRRCQKVFLGDAGSMLLGFVLVWLLIELSQGEQNVLSPVTALWLVAIPLLDTLSVMARRLGAGSSPFKADRRHLHYMLMQIVDQSHRVLLIIVFSAIVLTAIGIAGQQLLLAEAWMFYSGVLLLLFYDQLLAKSRLLNSLLRGQGTSISLRAASEQKNHLEPVSKRPS